MTSLKRDFPAFSMSGLQDGAVNAAAAYFDAVQRSVINFIEADPSMSAKSPGDVVRQLPRAVEDYLSSEMKNARDFWQGLSDAGSSIMMPNADQEAESNADHAVRLVRIFLQRTAHQRATLDGLVKFVAGRIDKMTADEITSVIKSNFDVDKDNFVTISDRASSSTRLPDSVTAHLASAGYPDLQTDVEYKVGEEEKPSKAIVALSSNGKTGVLYFRVYGAVDQPEKIENARVIAAALAPVCKVACVYITNGTDNVYLDPKSGAHLDNLPAEK